MVAVRKGERKGLDKLFAAEFERELLIQKLNRYGILPRQTKVALRGVLERMNPFDALLLVDALWRSLTNGNMWLCRSLESRRSDPLTVAPVVPIGLWKRCEDVVLEVLEMIHGFSKATINAEVYRKTVRLEVLHPNKFEASHPGVQCPEWLKSIQVD